MNEWIVILALCVAFAAGIYVGWRGHRWSILKALREAAERHLARTLDPIDHDAMLRIIKDHQGPR